MGGGYKYEHEYYPRKLKRIKRGSKEELAEYQYRGGDGCIRIMEVNVKNLVSWYYLRLSESKELGARPQKLIFTNFTGASDSRLGLDTVSISWGYHNTLSQTW